MRREEYDAVRDWLRMKWIPGDPTADDIVRLDDYLSLPGDERKSALSAMSAEDAERWLEVETSRDLYRDPVDRESGITEAKVARYPERYQWSPEDSP